MKYTLDHIVLNIQDDDTMINFYSQVLLMEPERLEEYRAGVVPFPSVRLNADTIIDLFPKKLWQKDTDDGEGRSNLNHFCVVLSKKDWQELKARLQANDVAIEDGPVPRWGAHGSGTSIYFRDPENNLIEVRYYQEQDSSENCLLGS